MTKPAWEIPLLTVMLLQFEANSGDLTLFFYQEAEVPVLILHAGLQPNEMSGTRYWSAGLAGSPTPLGDLMMPAHRFRSTRETQERARGEQGEETKGCVLVS